MPDLGPAGCLLITAGLLLFLFTLPLVALVHCLFAATGGSKTRRAVWAAVVVLLWPWGSLAYLGFGSRSRPLQLLAALFLLFHVGLVITAQQANRRWADIGVPAGIDSYPEASDAGLLRRTGGWGELRRPGWGNYVNSVAWSPDGRRVLVGRRQTLELREVATGRLLSLLESLPANEELAGWTTGRWGGRGGPVAWSPDGRFVLADEGSVSLRTWLGLWVMARQLVQGDRRLDWWDLESGESGHLSGHQSSIQAIRFLPGGERAVSAGMDGKLRLWDVGRGRRLAVLAANPWGLRAVAVSPDGRRALSGGSWSMLDDSFTEVLRLWDLEERRLLRNLDGHRDRVFAVAFTTDGRRAISASRDETLRVWDLDTGTQLRSIRARALGERFAFSPGARYAAAGGGVVEIWDLEQGRVVDAVDLRPLGDEARGIAFSPAGDRLALGTTAGAVLFFDWRPGGE